jgi:hypothetical protein
MPMKSIVGESECRTVVLEGSTTRLDVQVSRECLNLPEMGDGEYNSPSNSALELGRCKKKPSRKSPLLTEYDPVVRVFIVFSA